MGSGAWRSQDWTSYYSKTIDSKSVHEVYTTRGMKPEYDPNNVDRESCDSDDHPQSTPIIIGLDVTGSMGRILMAVADRLGDLVGEVLDRKPVTDPQIMFNAIGDSTCDDAPLQVTQFESDIRIASQLTELYFERGGGGNQFESYPLSWYFAANHTKIDSFDKRGRKGFLFTMGDDGCPSALTRAEVKRIFGDDIEDNVSIDELITQVNRKYEVFHLCLLQGSTYRAQDLDKWQKILGERAIPVSDYQKIPEIIVSILERMAGKSEEEIVKSWDGSTALVVREAIKGLSAKDAGGTLVEFN